MLDAREMFVQVVQAGSFSAASRKLGVPVSTLSDRVAQLEAELGTILLHRTTRRLIPTAAGLAYCDVIARTLSELRAFEEGLLDDAAAPAGRLRIASTIALDGLLAPIVGAYLDRHPAMSIDLVLGPASEDLLHGAIDLAIRLGALPDSSSLVGRTLGRSRMQLFASPGYLAGQRPIERPYDLTRTDLLCFAGTPSFDLRHGDGSTVRIDAAPRFTSNHLSSLLRQAIAGRGVAILPDALLASELAEGRIARVLPDWRSDDLPITAIYARHRVVPPRVRSFLDVLVAQFPRRLEALNPPKGRKVYPGVPG